MLKINKIMLLSFLVVSACNASSSVAGGGADKPVGVLYIKLNNTPSGLLYAGSLTNGYSFSYNADTCNYYITKTTSSGKCKNLLGLDLDKLKPAILAAVKKLETSKLQDIDV